MNYTTTELLTRIKRDVAVPSGQPAFSEDNLLLMATDEMLSTVVPMIISYAEEFYVKTADFPVVNQQIEYPIPSDAMGVKLREIKYYYNLDPNQMGLINIPRLSISQIHDASFGFYIQGNNVCIMNPGAYSSATLRMYYFQRPNALVQADACSLISSVINASAKTVQVSTLPAAWVNGEVVDIVQGQPPFDKILSVATISISSNIITLSDWDDRITGGCYISLEGETCVPQVPVEVSPLLSQLTAMKVMESLGDSAGLQIATAKYQQMEDRIKNMLGQRVNGEPTKILPNDALIRRDYYAVY